MVVINKSKETLLQSNANMFQFNKGDGTLTANYTRGSVTLPIPTRAGYTFNGWYTAENGGTKIGDGGAKYTPTAATTLYAQWTINTYTISYDANGGSGAPSSQTKTYGVDLTLSSTKPTRTNYTFLGWSTSSTATSATYSAGGTYTSNASATLHAVWANVKCVTGNTTTYYNSLAVALNRASTSAATTCTVLHDISENVTVSTALYNTTLDLNSKTLTGYIFNNNNSSKLTIQNGTVTTSGYYTIKNTGTMTIKNTTVSCTSTSTNAWTVVNDTGAGTMTLSGGTYKLTNSSSGSAIYNKATMNATDITVESSAFGIANIGTTATVNAAITIKSSKPGIFNDSSGTFTAYGRTISHPSYGTGFNAINNLNGKVYTFGQTTGGTRLGEVYVFWKESSTSVGIKVFGVTINACPTWRSSDQSDLQWYAATSATDGNNQTYYKCSVPYSNHNVASGPYYTHFYNGSTYVAGVGWYWDRF